MQVIRRHIIPLIHSLLSLVLFSALTWFFLYQHPDPDYNDILSVMIGALVTIVTIMFSAVLVALQLASAQFSPRVTRAFFGQNRMVQSAFYLFLFGIAYCLAVKFTYSSGLGAFRYPALPVLGTVFGFFLISFVLPRFVFYIADSINAATITRDIALRTVGEIDRLYGTECWIPGDCHLKIPNKPETGLLPVCVLDSGFLDRVQHAKLNQIALKYPEYTFYIEVIVGNFMTPGETLLHVHAPGQQTLPKGLEQSIRQAFVVNKYRSYEQDVLFGVRQLVDIGIKAISPAVNDPTTCVNCLHYLGVIVRHYALARVPSVELRAAPGNLYYREFSFKMLLNAAFDQIFQWGRHDYVVVSQLLNTLAEVVKDIENPDYRSAIARQMLDFELTELKFDLPEQHSRVQNALDRLHKGFER